jgi:ferric-dicitrate binding protein FerR (iron transport regulator)
MLTVPRGGGIAGITLSDGTRVWLNAGSSLTYPVVFTGTQRKVIMSGESYFEVADNAARPFIVKKGDNEVTVLGTHFNVNAYDDEQVIKVTLLEGSVKVSQLATKEARLVSPGQQVYITESPGTRPKMELRKNADIEKEMAWKNGIFNFDQEPITEIMLQLTRWYDADISYEGGIPEDLFSGIIKRDKNVSQVLKLLEKTNRVHFKIDGRKITVAK